MSRILNMFKQLHFHSYEIVESGGTKYRIEKFPFNNEYNTQLTLVREKEVTMRCKICGKEKIEVQEI